MFKCDKCPKVYLSQDALDVHKTMDPHIEREKNKQSQLFDNIQNKNFICPYCSQKFQNSGELLSHSFNKHLLDKNQVK